MTDPGRLCACGCGTKLAPAPPAWGKRYLNDAHRKRQHRRDERAEHRELKAAARITGGTVIQGGALVTEAFRSSATVR